MQRIVCACAASVVWGAVLTQLIIPLFLLYGDGISGNNGNNGKSQEEEQQQQQQQQPTTTPKNTTTTTTRRTVEEEEEEEEEAAVNGAETGEKKAKQQQQQQQHQLYRPHIVFVVMDDMGSNDLGMHGRSGIATPVADGLARDGMYFNGSYYVLPMCTPTRITFMTGRYPYAMGNYGAINIKDTYGMPLDEETLPQILKKVGYTNHAVGKWHLGHSRYEYHPTYRGFDSFIGFYHAQQNHFQHAWKGAYGLWKESGPNCGPNCTYAVDKRGNYSSHLFAREAITIIQEHAAASTSDQQQQQKPLFLYLAYAAVHGPWQVPAKYEAPYLQHVANGVKGWNRQKATYAGMLTAADETLGTIIEALKHNGNMWDDTVLIYTSDNGAAKNRGGSNYPHQGWKKDAAWEGGVISDGIIAAGPKAREKLGLRKQHGTMITSLMHSVDWVPTLADMVGAQPNGNKPLHGVSQLKTFQGEGEEVGPTKAARNEVFLGHSVEFQGGHHAVAMRRGNLKYVWDYGGSDGIDNNGSSRKEYPV